MSSSESKINSSLPIPLPNFNVLNSTYLISGTAEPKGVSCLRLLEHWNTHEGKRQSFHQLALRLRQLGKKDVADRLAKSVSSEKIAEVQESFLSDPFKSRIHTNSPLLQESPHVETPEPEPKEVQHWTAFETIVSVFLSLTGAVVLFIIGMSVLKCFLPDSFARMRASFYLSFTGKRPGEENLYFLL